MKKYVVIIIFYYCAVFWMRLHSLFPSHKFSIKFLDVGQGDAIYLTIDRVNMLIDAGPVDSLQKYIPEYFYPFCNLDVVYITHLHLDHFGGLLEVLKFCKPISYMFNDISLSGFSHTKLLELIGKNSKNKNLTTPIYANKKFELGDLKIVTLWPDKKFVDQMKPSDDLNQMSTVLFIDYKDFEALLTGDAEAETLQKIDLNMILPLINEKLDVLKVPHHGAIKGLTEALLSKLKPDYCVISSGIGNKYGHPSSYTLFLLEKTGCHILRTDKVGTIEFTAD